MTGDPRSDPPAATAPPQRSATRQALPLVLARAAAAVITVMIPLYLARRLTLDEYGTYKQVFLLCGPLLSMLPLGVVQSLYFFVPRAHQPRAVLLQTEAFNVGMGVLGAVIIWLGLPVAAEAFPNPALLQFRRELALYVLFYLAAMPLETMLTSQGRTRVSALTYVGTELLKSAALVIPVILGHGLRGSIAALAAVVSLRFAVAAALAFRAPGGAPSVKGLRGQLVYALPFGAAMALNVLQQNAHLYAVSLTVTPALYAIYAVGCFQVPLVNLLYAPTSEVLMVRVGQMDRHGAGQRAAALFREATRKLALVFIPASGFLICAAPWVVRVLFGSKFDAAAPILRVSVLGIALASIPLDGLLRARGETRRLFLAYLVKAAVTVPILWVLVPRFGLLGGIIGSLSTEVIGKALLLASLPRALAAGGPVPAVREWLPVRDLVRVCGATIACAAAVRLLAPHLDGLLVSTAGRMGAVVHVLVAGTIFGGTLLALMQLLGLRPMALLTSLRR